MIDSQEAHQQAAGDEAMAWGEKGYQSSKKNLS